MDEREKEYLYWLNSTAELGAVSLRRLYEHFHSYERIYHIEETELRQAGFLKERQICAIMERKEQYPKLREEYQALAGRGIGTVTFLDAEYPQRLLEIYDYPPLLFYRGHLPENGVPSVAIVGARGCSRYGEQITEKFAGALAAEHVQIISGLATGIDTAAHTGALKIGGGRTFGVLGCGINICYPRNNYLLYENMQENGGVLTEFPCNTPPLKQNFPMRNRLISGLADVVLVAEAKEKSGSLITAELGLEQGREIFAFPGRITDRLSAGCNLLIAQGARPALYPDDILEYLELCHGRKLVIREKNMARLAKREKMVYSFLDFTPKHLDEVVADTGLSVTECMDSLLELELGGYVFCTSNQYYGRKL